MAIYKVFVSFDGQGVYTVKAKSKKDAENNYADNFIDYEDLPENCINEEVIEVKTERFN